MYIVGTVILSFMFSNILHAIDAWYMFKSTISNILNIPYLIQYYAWSGRQIRSSEMSFFLSAMTSVVQFKPSTPNVFDTDQQTTSDQCLHSLLQAYNTTISVKHESKTI